MSSSPRPLSLEDLHAETGAVLPAKEVLSVPLLDLNVDVDLALALAAPIDLAVAGNLNVALPIDAAVSANVLSVLSSSAAAATQDVVIDQLITGEAIADGLQDAEIDQTAPEAGSTTGETTDAAGVEALPAAAGTTELAPDGTVVDQPVAESTDPVATDGTTTDGTTTDGTTTEPVAEVTDPVADAAGAVTQDVVDLIDPSALLGDTLEAGLLNVDAKIALDADIAAPIAGAVALNANVAAPIDAAVAANIGTIGSEAIAVANQSAQITQHLTDVTAHATADQTAEIDQ